MKGKCKRKYTLVLTKKERIIVLDSLRYMVVNADGIGLSYKEENRINRVLEAIEDVE